MPLRRAKIPLHKQGDFPRLARLKGFEPLTLWFVAKYSIQLSYRRITLLPKLRQRYYYTTISGICQGVFEIFLQIWRKFSFLGETANHLDSFSWAERGISDH